MPQQLIQQADDGSFVWVADQSAGVARRTTVQIGELGYVALVEVTGGLKLTDRIISSEIGTLQDGDRIRVASEDVTIGIGDEMQLGVKP